MGCDIIEDRENSLSPGLQLKEQTLTTLVLWFKPAPGDRGTEVKVVIEYAPAWWSSSILAKLFGEEPQQQIGDELRRFKMLMKRAKFRQQKVNQRAEACRATPDRRWRLITLHPFNQNQKSMKAVCWYGANEVRVTVPDPKILNPRDAILKVTSTAICGSDLHIYGGYIPQCSKVTLWSRVHGRNRRSWWWVNNLKVAIA